MRALGSKNVYDLFVKPCGYHVALGVRLNKASGNIMCLAFFNLQMSNKEHSLRISRFLLKVITTW